MTDAEKKAAETAAAEAAKAEQEKADAEFEASLEGLPEEEQAKQLAEKEAREKEPSKPDYEAIAKQERERREAAERAAADAAFKLREAKRKKDEEEEEEEDEEKPITASQLQAVLAKERVENQKILQTGQALEYARALTTSEAEAQAAVEIWRNRVNPTGSIETDIKFAIGGLNADRLLAQNAELRRAVKSKETRSDNPANTEHEEAKGSIPKLSPADLKAMRDAGWVWDGKQFATTLPNKKKRFTDGKGNFWNG